MSPVPASPVGARRRRARRVVMFLVPPLALAILALIGRFAAKSVAPISNAEAAAIGTSPAPSVESEAGATSETGGSESGALAVSDAPGADAPKLAIEPLADGGFIVDLNLANETELEKLPGVGPSRARAIVALRGRLGKFRGVDDLARIKGFGRALIRRLRPMVRAT